MSSNKCAAAGLALLLAVCAGTSHAADDGLITKPSKYSVKETVTRFEDAVKQKEAAGFMVSPKSIILPPPRSSASTCGHAQSSYSVIRSWERPP